MKMDRRHGDIVEAKDLSPILSLTSEEEQWLRELTSRVDAHAFRLAFNKRETDESPIAYLDWQTGQWWAGRFIGELTFRGRTLRILPRFGMPALHHWLSRITSARFLPSKGNYSGSHVWLWELLARLWANRLLVAAKHGLPRVRNNESYVGVAIRGRLQVRESAIRLNSGQRCLASITRNRCVDAHIGGILLAAFDRLRRELQHFGEERTWLTERGASLVRELRTGLDHRAPADACRDKTPVRYTPITESYRSAVTLSRAILDNRPISTSSCGDSDVVGILLDMAELWELYVFHVLRDGLSEAQVVHSGRSECPSAWLLRGRIPGDKIGALKPDILVSLPRSAKRIVVDAKYKLTTPSRARPEGIQREDLYQLTAYMAGLEPETRFGGLVYPATEQIAALSKRGPFRFERSVSQLCLMGLECDSQGHEQIAKTSEEALVREIRVLLMDGAQIA